MQSIITTLRTGTGTERLAVVADLVSIAGVSFASIAGGIFALTTSAGSSNLRLDQIGAASIFSLLSLAGAVLVLAVFLVVVSMLKQWQPRVAVVRPLVTTAVCLGFASLVLIAAWAYYDLFSSFRFVHSGSGGG